MASALPIVAASYRIKRFAGLQGKPLADLFQVEIKAIKSSQDAVLGKFIMKIHEYQAKAILKKYGVAVPRGEMAETRDRGGSGGERVARCRAPPASW